MDGNWMLISVCDREICTERFATHELAIEQMKKEMKSALWYSPTDPEVVDIFSRDEYDNNDDIAFGEWGGYVNGHDECDWHIVSL